jgi:FAD dependent oxidoreductase
VVVYSATPAGIAAAIAAAREHSRVALLEPSNHVGGMMASGLGFSDIGVRNKIGGLALHLYRRLGAAYQMGAAAVSWNMTPAVAERVFSAMLAQANVSVFTGQRLRESGGVALRGTTIQAISTVSGRTFEGRVFIDASYEGDLMAAAGVSFVVGRESAGTYGESLAGVRPPQPEKPPIGASSTSGAPAPGVDGGAVGAVGSADARIQPYTFRLCVTDVAANQVPFPRPPGYDPARYLLVQRHLAAIQSAGRVPALANVLTINPLPQGKADLNAAGPLSTDLLGASDAYPAASYAQRQQIWDEHYRYEAGLLYFLANDPSVPNSVQSELLSWGLCRDEFVDSGHWPRLLYIRESRRMVSDFVLTQADLLTNRHKPDAIGVASYRIDAHATRLIADAHGMLVFEGLLSAPIGGPYDIPYRILVPRRAEIVNLIDPVTVSASHVAMASLRMEPQYMAMGEAAGTAAALAIQSGVAVQDVDVAALQARLKAHAAVIRIPSAVGQAAATPPAAPTARPVSTSLPPGLWLIALAVLVLGWLGVSALRRRRG